MTNLQIAALVQPSMVTQLLTADGGEWEVSKYLQEIMALAADGTLYLSESHQNDIHVLSFIDRLDRRGFRYQLNLTDLQTIHQLYRAVAMDGLVDSDGQRATQMQERVVKIIRKATELRASDVHFVVSPAGTGSKIRFRVDGLLKTVEQYRSQELHELCATIYQSMCDVAEPLFKPQLDQDARMSQAFVEKLNLFGARIATRPRAGGFLMILRLHLRRYRPRQPGAARLPARAERAVRSHDAHALRHQHPVRPHRVREVDDLEGHHGRTR
ncbi:hypothetical protein [Pseudomonas aeruginosa]|uniref:ATPase, T2SS/T4P/T4SS family n=1 Tax=Pseudomonas aeruginosa TaxID=287 RepID=UPI002278803C|nr:hypothetical protein [Pseudomonas aeruginosa]WAE31391.1 hypothetical protein OSZ60_14350 [Pseudomonas aeruginosa]